ncbi:MAG: WD40 repeat domain-containing protein [Stellaceae bacterium]
MPARRNPPGLSRLHRHRPFVERKYRATLFILFGLLWVNAAMAAPTPSSPARSLYAVNQAAAGRGSISVYDIEAGHRLVKTIRTVANVGDVRGVAVSAITGKLYVAYQDVSGTGMVYCLNVYDDTIVWNRVVSPGVDRLAINPNGQVLYVPTWEGGSADYINVLNANTGDAVRQVRFSNRSHDTQYPLSGPIFQETKADDGSGSYLYLIDPVSYAVSRIGPYAGVLGPYAVDSTRSYAVNNVRDLWGMQVANLKTDQIITAGIPDHPPGDAGLLHGIGWSPDQTEVWLNGTGSDPHVYIWDMRNPTTPVLKDRLTLRSGRGSHWLTFDIKGNYGYIAPNKNSADGTEIFDARTRNSVGVIGSSEDLLEIDFVNGKISEVGDQYGIGRR